MEAPVQSLFMLMTCYNILVDCLSSVSCDAMLIVIRTENFTASARDFENYL